MHHFYNIFLHHTSRKFWAFKLSAVCICAVTHTYNISQSIIKLINFCLSYNKKDCEWFSWITVYIDITGEWLPLIQWLGAVYSDNPTSRPPCQCQYGKPYINNCCLTVIWEAVYVSMCLVSAKFQLMRCSIARSGFQLCVDNAALARCCNHACTHTHTDITTTTTTTATAIILPWHYERWYKPTNTASVSLDNC